MKFADETTFSLLYFLGLKRFSSSIANGSGRMCSSIDESYLRTLNNHTKQLIRWETRCLNPGKQFEGWNNQLKHTEVYSLKLLKQSVDISCEVDISAILISIPFVAMRSQRCASILIHTTNDIQIISFSLSPISRDYSGSISLHYMLRYVLWNKTFILYIHPPYNVESSPCPNMYNGRYNMILVYHWLC